MTEKMWILVAESSFARLFETTKGHFGTLTEIQAFKHPASRLHEHDLYADHAGRSFDSMGHGRHAMEPKTHVKEHEGDVFAKELVDFLEKARENQSFHYLAVMAPPHMLGELRQHYSKPLAQMITAEVDKNLTHQPTEQILAQLP